MKYFLPPTPAVPDRLPPHSIEAEQGVLGCILLSPGDCLPDCIEKLKPGHLAFYDLRHQTLFQTMLEMHAENQAIDLITLQQRLRNEKQMEGVGGLPYICTLPDAVPSAANLDCYLDIVLEKYRLRKMVQTCTGIVGRVFDHKGGTEEFLAAARADLFDCTTGRGDSTQAILKTRRFDPIVTRPPQRVVFTLKVQEEDITIATSGNLFALYAQAKAGKTAVIGAMLASIMRNKHDADCFGFKSSNPDGRAVISFDTEQSPYAHDDQAKRVLRRAGLADPPPWFYSYTLAGLDLPQILRCIEGAIESATTERGGIHSIFLDGIGDCVPSVNDEVSGNSFVAHLHGLSITHDCVTVCALHFNPVSSTKNAPTKARGHLGSQLERKAESNFQLEKDADGITQLWADKNRNAGILKGKCPCFRWDDAAGMHLSVATAGARNANKKADALRSELADAFEGKPSLSYTDLKAFLMEQSKVVASTAGEKIRAATELGVIEKTVNRYTLKA